MYLPPPVLSNPTSPSSISNPPSYPCGPWYWIPIDHGTGQFGVVYPGLGIGGLSNCTESDITFFVELASLQDVHTPISTTTCFLLEGHVFLRIGALPSAFSHQTQMHLFRKPREGVSLFFWRLTCAHMLIIKIVCLFEFPSKFQVLFFPHNFVPIFSIILFPPKILFSS